MTISSKDDFVASASRDRSIKLWSLASKRQILALEGHQDGVLSLDLSKDDKCLVSGGEDDSIIVWSLQTKQQTQTLEGHTNGVSSVKFV